MMKKNDKLILNIILIFSIFTLSTAYFIQYILGHEPCNLCLIERYPYLGAIILISFIFIINRFEKLILYIILLLFVLGAIISFYHVGIEQGFVEETFVCELSMGEKNLSKESIMKQLRNSTPISCKIVTFKFLGLSLATINTVISIFLSVIMLKIIKGYDKN